MPRFLIIVAIAIILAVISRLFDISFLWILGVMIVLTLIIWLIRKSTGYDEGMPYAELSETYGYKPIFPNLYKGLKVPFGASIEDIRRGYEERMEFLRKPQIQEFDQGLEEAHGWSMESVAKETLDILSDPKSRAAYDKLYLFVLENQEEQQESRPNQSESTDSSLRLVNCYGILNVPSNASHDEIEDAYLQRSKEWEPDTNNEPLPSDADVMRDINTAWKVLSDSEMREMYDRMLLSVLIDD